MQLNYWHSDILKLKFEILLTFKYFETETWKSVALSFWSCFFVPTLLDNKILLPFFLDTKSQISAVSFLEKFPELIKDSKGIPFAKWQNCQVRKICYRHKNIYPPKNLTVSIVSKWYLPIVNLLSFLPVLTQSR